MPQGVLLSYKSVVAGPLHTPFPPATHLTEQTGLREQRQTGLTSVSPENGEEPPSVVGLAERIKR